MRKRARASEFFLKPPIWFDMIVWAATAVAIGASVAFLCLDIRAELWAFALYAASLLFIVFSVYLLLTFRDIPSRIVKNKHVRRFVADFGFRSYVLTVCSALINFLYVIFGTVVAVLNRSAWLGALVWYHAVLAAARAVSVITVGRHSKKPDFAEYKVKMYLYVGAMLNVLALATAPVVLLVVWQQNSYTFFGIAIIYTVALAAYSFVKLALSLRNIRRARRSGDTALAAIRNIGVCDALISMFALQATMFAAFGGEDIANVMNPLTGSVVAGFILFLGLYMIVRATRMLRQDGAGRLRVKTMAELSTDTVVDPLDGEITVDVKSIEENGSETARKTGAEVPSDSERPDL